VLQDGLTPLHIAAKTGNMEIVRYLVLSGADVDEYNEVDYHQLVNSNSRSDLHTHPGIA